MKLPLSLLKKYIHLPTEDLSTLRHTLDDLGLEVEEILYEGGDVIFKIETLAHRGDHLYAQGVARELSARYLIPTIPTETVEELPSKELPLEVTVETESCLRYALMSLGFVENIVDLLNNILAELGQPMHAFDQDCVDGAVHVVVSTQDEDVLALDGKTYTVPRGSILIRDDKKTLAVAGVIGCFNSMVTSKTKRVLVESATFDPVCVRKTAKKMGISTDASYTYERGADREKVLFALRRLVRLIPSVKSVGLYYHPGVEPSPKKLTLSFPRLRALLNASDISREEIEERLLYLGYTVFGRDADSTTLIPPSWREWNVDSSTTIIEDFARTYGLNSLQSVLPPLDYTKPALQENERILTAVEKSLLGNGFYEVMTKSYYSQEVVGFLNELQAGIDQKHVAIKNSVEKDYSHLKITNIVHLARLSEYNLRRGITSFKVYEFGRLFSMKRKSTTYEFERDVLSFACAGRWYTGEWKEEESRESKILLLKGLIEALFTSLGHTVTIQVSSCSYLHPGFQCSLLLQGKEVGYFGLLHPQLQERLVIEHDFLYGEIDLDVVKSLPSVRQKPPISDYPSIRRDITLKLPKKGLATKVIECLKSQAPRDLSSVCIVDSFEKENEEFRRVTYRFSFQSQERTLQHTEVDGVMDKLMASLQEQGFSLV